MSDRPLTVFSPPQQQGERPRFVFFNSSPSSIFSQRYGENSHDPLRRWVDIGDEHFAQIEKTVASLKGTQGVTIGKPERTGIAFNLDEFQQIRFGQPRITAGEGGKNSYRGYIMIEPENLFDAIQRLNYVGRLRLRQGKHLEYKWLQPMVRHETADRIKALGGRYNQALYAANPMIALATLYADNRMQIQETFEQLVTQAGWGDIEIKKRDISSGINITKPQHGQARYIHDGKEFFTLEMNTQPGFAEYLTAPQVK